MKLLLTLIIAATSLFANAQFRAIGLAKNQQCVNNLKQMGLSYQMHLQDHRKGPETFKDLESYTGRTIQDCPNARQNKQYILIPGTIAASDNCPVIMDRIGNHPNEINVLYRNGRTATIRYAGNNYSNLISQFKGLAKEEQKKLTDFFRKLDQKK